MRVIHARAVYQEESSGLGETPGRKMWDMAKKNPHAVALGRKGGKRGGKARWKDMSPEQRSEFMRQAALKRWRQRPTT